MSTTLRLTTLSLFLGAFVLLVPAGQAQAADTVQDVHNVDSANVYETGGGLMQGLGTGLTGTTTAGSGVWVKGNGSFIFATMFEFPDEASYLNCYDYGMGGSGDCSTYSTRTNFFFTGNGSAQINPIEDYHFSEDKYYLIRYPSTNVNPIYALGASDDLYPGGECRTYPGSSAGCGSIEDLGFRLYGVGASTIPPLSEYNEVVRYWPSSNYATSTGITTVGVQFSIGHPEWIEGVGFELSGTPDTSASTTVSYTSLLYEASTTVATPQVFSLTTDYNFTKGGYYVLSAYFIQNGNKIYNRSTGTILIDYTPPNITIGNDGQFHFNGTTTVATSTLDALHIDCGDTIIVSAICKLAVSFVIPDPSAIQQVKDSWNAVLTKAPFSFFTDSAGILQAIHGGSAVSRTFAVNLFGHTTTIISASTTDSIGLDSDGRALMIFFMQIGLWILFAWFLYWRIASIFGV